MDQQPGALHVTGPFILGKTLCDPFRYATVAELFGTHASRDDVAPAAADIRGHCDHVGHFNGRRRQPRPDDSDHVTNRDPSADWASTYGAGSPLSFRFDGCKGQWHRPGARMEHYAKALAAMNVTHHLKTIA